MRVLFLLIGPSKKSYNIYLVIHKFDILNSSSLFLIHLVLHIDCHLFVHIEVQYHTHFHRNTVHHVVTQNTYTLYMLHCRWTDHIRIVLVRLISLDGHHLRNIQCTLDCSCRNLQDS